MATDLEVFMAMAERFRRRNEGRREVTIETLYSDKFETTTIEVYVSERHESVDMIFDANGDLVDLG